MEDTNLNMLLDQLFNELKKVNPSLCDIFNEGVSKEFVAALANNLPILLPDEVYDFFSWKNGLNDELSSMKNIGEVEILSLGIPSSIEDSIQAYTFYALENPFWSTSIFPLFHSGGGDYYLIDCNQDSESFRMIYYFSNALVEFEGFVTMYDSLQNVIYSTLECFRQKAYSYRPSRPEDFADGPYLTIDRDLEATICKEINPRSEYWKMF